MRVSLVGVSCVGTTTIGRILADRRGWPFFDLDDEIERHFGLPIERLQARFLTGYDYRKHCAVVLKRIATANPDCVIALPVLVENSAASSDLGFHAACRYSLISPASLVRRWIWVGGAGRAMTSGASSGARRPMPSP